MKRSERPRPLRVLFFTTGPESEPSSRFRVHQLLPGLRKRGVEATVRPLADRSYLELGYGLHQPGSLRRSARVAAHFARRVIRRAVDLVRATRYDVLVVQKETFPFGMERLVRALGLRVVVDLDDAVFVPSPLPDARGGLARRVAERLLDRRRALAALVSRSQAVIAGSPALATFAREHCDAVSVIPTAVDADAYPRVPVRRSGTLTIGWIGAPPNAVYLEPLRSVFQALARRFDVRVHLAGPSAFACPGVEVTCTGWRHYDSVQDEVADFGHFDVGIMPLPDHAFARGKCAFKAIQYMASGLPVVASPVGVNAEVIGDAGLLARDPEEWEEALARLLADPDLRERMGERGRARVRDRYDLRLVVPRFAAVLERAADGSADGAPACHNPGAAALSGGRAPDGPPC